MPISNTGTSIRLPSVTCVHPGGACKGVSESELTRANCQTTTLRSEEDGQAHSGIRYT